jgi:hypothetical protein
MKLTFRWLVLAMTLLTATQLMASPLPTSSLADATTPGPHSVASGEYRLTPTVYPEVLPDRITEVWAKVFYPEDIRSLSAPLPLLVLLHGNHATCGRGSNPRIDDNTQYSQTGQCPKGYVTVPSHEGYNYFAQHLASWGYLVISINVNRGINAADEADEDIGLIKARGKMVLKHLNLLYEWSTSGNAPTMIGVGPQGLIGKIDFNAVGLFGHSRGGQGVRAAYELYQQSGSEWPRKIPGLSIKAIYEVGATDFYSGSFKPINAYGVAWNQLLPMCDGDVSDLQGRFPFERMMLSKTQPDSAQKSLYEVWGANHNFFNTEWQRSDAQAGQCAGEKAIFDEHAIGSEKQQKTALASVTAFFRSHVGTQHEDKLDLYFNPLSALPSELTQVTEIGRDFAPTSHATDTLVFDDFDQSTGTNSYGYQNIMQNVTVTHAGTQPKRAELSWTTSGQQVLFESVWAAPQQGKDIHEYATFDFRVSRFAHKTNPKPETDFDISLVDAEGKVSNSVAISDFIILDGPVGYTTWNNSPNSHVFKTVRIPLTKFSGVNLSNIHSIKFIFNKTESGAINLANLRLQKNYGEGYNEQSVPSLLIQRQQTRLTHAQTPAHPTVSMPEVPQNLNTIREISIQKVSTRSTTTAPAIEIKLASTVPFLVKDALPTLMVGDKHITRSRYSDREYSKEITFIVSKQEYEKLDKNKAVYVIYGNRWKFETLNQHLSVHPLSLRH